MDLAANPGSERTRPGLAEEIDHRSAHAGLIN